MKFLRREEIGVDLIKGDPNQPRKYFNPEIIHSMAATMVSNLKKDQVGIINDIEIDDKYIIITGEQRWKAAKLAGLKTIPCKVYSDFDQDERFFRQGLENLSRGSMTALEMSNWVVKVLRSLGWTKVIQPGWNVKIGKEGFLKGNGYVKALTQKTGRSDQWVYDMLALQQEKPAVREYLKKPDSKYSIIREINNRAPEELQDRLKEKVVKGSLKDRETTNELIRALTGYDESEEPKGKVKQQLLDTDYSASRSSRNIKKIDDIYPESRVEQTESERDSELGDRLSKNIIELTVLIGRIDLNKISSSHKPLIINVCKALIDRLNLIIDVLSGRLLVGEEASEE